MEKEVNYENESHTYINKDSTDLSTSTTETVAIINFAFQYQNPIDLSANWIDLYFNFFNNNTFPPPPKRLFLRHSSLLI